MQNQIQSEEQGEEQGEEQSEKQCRLCGSIDCEFIPLSWKKGVICRKCHNDLNRISNRKSRNKHKEKRDTERQIQKMLYDCAKDIENEI